MSNSSSAEAESFQRRANECFSKADDLIRAGKKSEAEAETKMGVRWQNLADEALRKN